MDPLCGPDIPGIIPIFRANIYVPPGYLSCMSSRIWIVLFISLVIGTCILPGCVVLPPAIEAPRALIDNYVLAYNRGDADTVYGMLVFFNSPRHHPQYATAQDVERIIHEKRNLEGIRILDYHITEEYIIEGYAVISLDITWERGDEQLQESHDAGFVYLNREWRLTDLILPPSF